MSGEPMEHDLYVLGCKAALETADYLVKRGYMDEAWAEGTTVYARRGKSRFVMRNHINRGESGLTDRLHDAFAAAVVDSHLTRSEV